MNKSILLHKLDNNMLQNIQEIYLPFGQKLLALQYSSPVWCMISCVCHTTPTQNNGSVCSILSGWATTTSRLHGSKDTTTCYYIRSQPRFSILTITSLVLYQLSYAVLGVTPPPFVENVTYLGYT